MTGDVCKDCGNFEPCQCTEVADQETTCIVCGVTLYVPAWAIGHAYTVTCYDHQTCNSVVGVHTPTEYYRPATPEDISWNNDPSTNWGMY